jgi:hypothetical protein
MVGFFSRVKTKSGGKKDEKDEPGEPLICFRSFSKLQLATPSNQVAVARWRKKIRARVQEITD